MLVDKDIFYYKLLQSKQIEKVRNYQREQYTSCLKCKYIQTLQVYEYIDKFTKKTVNLIQSVKNSCGK